MGYDPRIRDLTTSFPLGSSENPQTDPAAARNAALPTNWWATGATVPTNIVNGDFIVSPATAVPGQVVGVVTSAVGSAGFTVSWTALANTTSYTVEHRVKNVTTPNAYTAVTGVVGTSRALSGLTAGTVYEVRVTGVNATGAGTPSLVVEVTTSAALAKVSTLAAAGFTLTAGATIATGTISITQTSGLAAKSTARYDFTGSQMRVRNTVPASGGGVLRLEQSAGNHVDFYRSVQFNVIAFRLAVGGAVTEVSIPYDATIQHLRLRQAAGRTLWETSADNITYTVRRDIADPFVLTDVQAQLAGFDGLATESSTFAEINV